LTIPIISIVGLSNSGKTTLIEKLIAELTRRGYRVATIKHNRAGFEIDHEGKDSWRHKHAGAVATVIASPSLVAVIEDADHDHDIKELVDIYIHHADIVLVEGFKKNPWPKIEVYRTELKRERLTKPNDNVIALVVDDKNKADTNVPCFDRNDAVGIVDFITQRLPTRQK
jgi:molybdopterin-guanine dinucleotide biosynthesis adapter protein